MGECRELGGQVHISQGFLDVIGVCACPNESGTKLVRLPELETNAFRVAKQSFVRDLWGEESEYPALLASEVFPIPESEPFQDLAVAVLAFFDMALSTRGGQVLGQFQLLVDNMNIPGVVKESAPFSHLGVDPDPELNVRFESGGFDEKQRISCHGLCDGSRDGQEQEADKNLQEKLHGSLLLTSIVVEPLSGVIECLGRGIESAWAGVATIMRSRQFRCHALASVPAPGVTVPRHASKGGTIFSSSCSCFFVETFELAAVYFFVVGLI